MIFLALTTTQVLLLTVLTAAAVVVLFFLKLRRRRVVVASSLLWRRVLDDSETSSLMEKLRRWISLAVALAIALLIALSLGRPQIEALSGQMRPIVIVVDSSPTMATRTSTGRTRWEAAVEQARRILENTNSPAGFLAADTSGRVQTPLTGDRAAISAALDRMRPFPGQLGFPDVPISGTDLYFISDGVAPLDVPVSAHSVSVFEPADNVGITAFEVQVDPTSPSGYRAHLEVSNYSEEDKNVRILMSGAGGGRATRAISIQTGGAWKSQFDMSQFDGGGIRVSVQADGDALAIDDTAFAYLPMRTRARVILVTRATGGYLETLLRLSPGVNLSVVRPEDFRETTTSDVYTFEGLAPGVEPAKPSLVFGAANVGWLPRPVRTVQEPRVASWDSDHPIMPFVQLHDLKIERAGQIEAGDATVVASSEEGPLIVAMDGPRKRVLVTFDLESSDFALHLGFPVFVQNVLRWFSGEALAQRTGLGVIEFPVETSSVTRLDGSELGTESRFGRTVVEMTEPDLLAATDSGRRVRVAANLTDRRSSDVNRSSFAPGGGVGALTLPALSNELWFYMLFLALVLVAAEWWTYHRRITL